MNNKIITSLTFQDGNAEQAMEFYLSIFKNSRVIKINRWPKGGPVDEGKIMQAVFEINDHQFMCSDSPAIHDWDFSPAVSNYMNCESEEEINSLFKKLSTQGKITMPLNNYGFSKLFGWVIDQFGVSWQLNLD